MPAPLKIFHCADLHLGLRFSTYPEEIAAQLREARFSTLEKMVEKALEEGCGLFAIAGDLFDTLKVSQKDILRAARILSRFEGVVAVLPGNHDFHAGESDDFWKHFEAAEGSSLLLLKEAQAYPLQDRGIDAVIYAAPCSSKYSKQHRLAWLESTERLSGHYQIGMAHGSFEGLSPDLQGNYFPMKADDLHRCRLDLWLLGHIHVPYPPQPGRQDRIFYSGTHEPDGFDCRHEGRSWILELQPDNTLSASALSTGHFRFREEKIEVRSLSDLDALTKIPNPENSLIKLVLTGALPREAHEKMAARIEELKKNFFFLKTDFSQLGIALSAADIDREFLPGSFPHRLLSELQQTEGDSEALQVAFALLKEDAEA